MLVDRLGEERAKYVRGHNTVFPNFAYLSNGTIRCWHPRGPGQIEGVGMGSRPGQRTRRHEG